MEWLIIGCVVWIFWRRKRRSPAESEHKRFAVFYLSHLLATQVYDETSQRAITHLLHGRTPAKLAALFMNDFYTQQNFLVRSRMFTEFERMKPFIQEQFPAVLMETRKLFEIHGKIVNTDRHIAAGMRKLVGDGADVDEQYQFKMEALKEATLLVFQHVFHEDFHTYEAHMTADLQRGNT